MRQAVQMQPVGCVWERNGDDSLLYAVEFPGAFVRGEIREAALPDVFGFGEEPGRGEQV